jgi:hypothetical protein
MVEVDEAEAIEAKSPPTPLSSPIRMLATRHGSSGHHPAVHKENGFPGFAPEKA